VSEVTLEQGDKIVSQPQPWSPAYNPSRPPPPLPCSSTRPTSSSYPLPTLKTFRQKYLRESQEYIQTVDDVITMRRSGSQAEPRSRNTNKFGYGGGCRCRAGNGSGRTLATAVVVLASCANVAWGASGDSAFQWKFDGMVSLRCVVIRFIPVFCVQSHRLRGKMLFVEPCA
jgi:hypothetical protein